MFIWLASLALAADPVAVEWQKQESAHLQNIRAKLPSLANRQPNAYRWPTRV